MKKLVFEVTGYVEMVVDESVIDRANELVKDGFFSGRVTQSSVLENLAFNFLQNNAELPYLDGWADMEKSKAKLTFDEIEYKLQDIKEGKG